MAQSSQPHSAEHFGTQRDFWWNRDFLDLMAKRWQLNQAGSLADIGCGLCHWSRLLYPYLRKPARFTGVDQEPCWVTKGAQQFRDTFPQVAPDLLTFVQGTADQIPLPSSSFEVVTCQTVLMHLPHPLDGLAEMLRVVSHGGLLVCVEPSNLWNYMPYTSNTAAEPTKALVRQFEFWLRCHRGRIRAGLGDHNIGDLLPGYLAQLGLGDIQVYQSDRAASLFPPYGGAAQQAIVLQEIESKKSGAGQWNREELRRLVLEGAGSEESFEEVWPELEAKYRREQQAIATGLFHAGYGAITYLVSGRKR